MKVFRNAAGKLYAAEAATSEGDSGMPVCTKELMDILTNVGKPLSEAEIATCQLALETAVPGIEPIKPDSIAP